MSSKSFNWVSARAFSSFFILFIGLLISHSCFAKNPTILVFTKTAGFRHGSIEVGKKAIGKLGEENGFRLIRPATLTSLPKRRSRNMRQLCF